MNTTSSTDDLVSLDLTDTILTLTLRSSATGNALNLAMTAALSDALESVNAMREVRCVILRSDGKNFCTGGNVNDMRDGTDLMAGSTTEVRERLLRSLHRITRAVHGIEVPVIAAVNGMAIGAGFDLSLMCDVRLAGEDARFSESFLRLGLVSGIGGAWFLTRLVGVSKAMELTLTSEFIDAATALRLGIVSQVCPPDRLHAETLALARRIARNPPNGMRMAKQLVRDAAHSELSSALEQAASMQAILLCGSEHKEAVGRFLSSARTGN
jgi:enoyl-CoA hydratase/carnithine racemase